MANLVDRLITKVDKIRDRVNVNKVGVRRYRLFRVIRSWDGLEVGAGNATLQVDEILPVPAIQLGGEPDRLFGRGRQQDDSMRASEVSLSYTENFLEGQPLTAGQECYYKLIELNAAQASDTTYWIMLRRPEADRCETTSGNIQWKMIFSQYTSGGG